MVTRRRNQARVRMPRTFPMSLCAFTSSWTWIATVERCGRQQVFAIKYMHSCPRARTSLRDKSIPLRNTARLFAAPHFFPLSNLSFSPRMFSSPFFFLFLFAVLRGNKLRANEPRALTYDGGGFVSRLVSELNAMRARRQDSATHCGK